MKDIEIAKECLKKEDIRIALVRDGQVIFTSNEKGIKPMYRLAMEMKDQVSNASLADKVIGRGAAILCNYIGIKELHGILMSKSGMDYLDKMNIKYSYEEYSPHIENRDRSDLCPIEKLSMDTEDGDLLLEWIGEFLRNLP